MADRYAVLQKLGDGQNAMLGVAAGGIEAAATQPLTYAKNCFQQRTPLSLVPRVVYRGTPASMAADGTLIGTQFACCGFLQKRLLGGEARPLTAAEELGTAWLAGYASGVPCCVMELVMIQQQKNGGTAGGAVARVLAARGPRGLLRGFTASSFREGFFACCYLGAAPRVQRACDGLDLPPTAGAAVASTASGVLCAAVTHPFDTIKTVAQGDLGGAGFRGTTAAIYRDGGAAAFFRGFGARGALICCCFFIFNETKLRLGAALWPDELRDARAR